MHTPIWYLPTFHGDIRLESIVGGRTALFCHELTPTEMEAMRELRKRAIAPPPFRRKWATSSDFPELDTEFYRVGREQRVELDVSIATVQEFLARRLKPNRQLLGAARFESGKIVEVFNSEPKPVETYRQVPGQEKPSAPRATPSRTPYPPLPMPTSGKVLKSKSDEDKEADVEKAAKEAMEKVTAAVTVAKPVLGCPAPDFAPADVRANRVLDAFLDDQQRLDWRARGQIIARGYETGHRYMITSRDQRDQLARFGGRSLFDLEEGSPFCTHDWDVPAAEEVLALLLFISLPKRERYLRAIRDPLLGM